MDAHAQFEIQSYANVIGNEIVAKWVPFAWEAFKDFRINASALSRQEIEVIQAIQRGKDDAIESARSLGILPPAGQELKRSREREDLEAKLTMLGISIPWKT
jgi:thymidylate synthase (FAD)